MKIKVKKLGVLEQAEFELGKLTIICGKNNSGKTYATYALYGFLATWRKILSIPIDDEYINQLFESGATEIPLSRYIKNSKEIIGRAGKEYCKGIHNVFATSEDRFRNTELEIEVSNSIADKYQRTLRSQKAELFTIEKKSGEGSIIVTLLSDKNNISISNESIKIPIKEAILEIIFGSAFPRPFIASAERTGAAIFRKELNFARNRLLEEISSADKGKKIDPIKLFFTAYQDYALPVKTNVDFTRDLESIAKNTSFISKNHQKIMDIFSDIIGGEYVVTNKDELFYKPKGKSVKLSMDESSSAVRSLLDIGFYLKHVAKPGDLLMVDEPELNLHPENQRRVARLFAYLINIGIKVFITTHSDYIIKELNTLIMLNNDNPHIKNIAKEEGYQAEELLSASDIRVYIAEEEKVLLDGNKRKTICQTLIPADINQDQGIEAKSFDETIDQMNRIQEAIVWRE